jgi:ribulose-bisphosphate carboxylase large chain
MMPIAVLVRLCGGDQLHTGTARGKMESDLEEVRRINEFLKKDLFGLENVFPVASGGLHPGVVAAEVEAFGKDLILQAGGGIHGHPDGTEAGARAMRQAVDAVMEGKSLEEYAQDHEELNKALKKWGEKVEWGDLYG